MFPLQYGVSDVLFSQKSYKQFETSLIKVLNRK
jgi:hypothetical protein